jgi:hypothetical protein
MFFFFLVCEVSSGKFWLCAKDGGALFIYNNKSVGVGLASVCDFSQLGNKSIEILTIKGNISEKTNP